MGLHRPNSLTSLCSHDGDYKCEICLATTCEPSTTGQRYSIQAPTYSFEADRPLQMNVVAELMQTQLALWTFSMSALYAFAWRTNRGHPLFNLCVVIPAAVGLTSVLSALLAVLVVVGRVFFAETPVDYSDWVVAAHHHSPSPAISRCSSRSRKWSGESVTRCNRGGGDHNANYLWMKKPSTVSISGVPVQPHKLSRQPSNSRRSTT